MNIILHIGSDKTGTTALQSAFSRNKSVLEALGIIYPKINTTNHHECLVLELLSGTQGPAWAKLTEVIATQSETLLISSELLCSISKTDIDRLKSWLQPHQLSVICYIRSADEYLESGLIQRLKSCRSDREFTKRYRLTYWLPAFVNLYVLQAGAKNRFVQKWAKNFQPETFIVRPYCKNQWFQANIFSDFIHALNPDLDFNSDEEITEKRNITPNLEIAYAFHFFITSDLPWLKHEFSEIMTTQFGQIKNKPITSYWKRKLAVIISNYFNRIISKEIPFMAPVRSISKGHHAPDMKYIRTEAPIQLMKYTMHQRKHFNQKLKDLS